MLTIAILPLLVKLVVAVPSIDFLLTPGKSPLDVIASITNAGDNDISIMKFTPILAQIPVKHARIFDELGNEIPFRGVLATFDMEHAGADAWETIPAGQTIVRSIDFSKSHEVESAGQHTIWANGKFQVIDGLYSKEAAQSQTVYPYNKNLTTTLSSNDVVAYTERRLLQKRISIGACEGNQKSTIQNDFSGAKQLATEAAERTRAGDNRFSQFYHTTDARYSSAVANTFQKIGDAATVTTTSQIVANCNGDPSVCTANVLAYASFFVGSQGQGNLYTCPPFWNLPPTAPTCSGYGRAGVLVHELSHFYGTEDVIYGYAQSQNLTTGDAIRNADTYMFYSQSFSC